MENIDNKFQENLKGAILAEISIKQNGIGFQFKGQKNYHFIISDLSKIIIEPRNFDCPIGMSLHTQILWFFDEVFGLFNQEIIDIKIIENEIFAIQFAAGILAFKIDKKGILEIFEGDTKIF